MSGARGSLFAAEMMPLAIDYIAPLLDFKQAAMFHVFSEDFWIFHGYEGSDVKRPVAAFAAEMMPL